MRASFPVDPSLQSGIIEAIEGLGGGGGDCTGTLCPLPFIIMPLPKMQYVITPLVKTATIL